MGEGWGWGWRKNVGVFFIDSRYIWSALKVGMQIYLTIFWGLFFQKIYKFLPIQANTIENGPNHKKNTVP